MKDTPVSGPIREERKEESTKKKLLQYKACLN